MKIRRHIIKLIFVFYILGVLYITLLDRSIGESRHMLDAPFWEYKKLFSDSSAEVFFWQIFGNLLMLLPFGMMLPGLFEKARSLGFVALAGFLFSAFIEITQYVTGRGLCEFDDVFNNTLGAVIGYLIVRRRYSEK